MRNFCWINRQNNIYVSKLDRRNKLIWGDLMQYCRKCPDAAARIIGGAEAPQLSGCVQFYHENGCVLVVARIVGLPKESETELYRLMKEQCVDIITFTSSSTVHHFMKVMDKHNLRECLSDSIIACIGPIAEKTAKQYGLNVQICADPFTVEGLVKKLVIFEG